MWRTIATRLTLAALEGAIRVRQPAIGRIPPSHRGVHYASSADVAGLSSMGAQISLSAKGNPDENAKAESFFKRLKREEL